VTTQPHKGSPSNPFTWDEACEKFRRYTARLLEPARATAVVDAVSRCEQAVDVAAIARL
jgi:hypothetical protein